MGHLREQRLARLVEVLDEVDDATLVLKSRLCLLVTALVLEHDFESAVEECDRLQAFENGARHELDSFRGEDRRIRPEADRGAARPVLLR